MEKWHQIGSELIGKKKVFLFESKGTCNKNVRKKTIEHAKVQLNNVGSIKDTSTNQMYYPQKDSKHVICSCFDAYSGIDKVWNIHDVDPEGKGEVNLTYCATSNRLCENL